MGSFFWWLGCLVAGVAFGGESVRDRLQRKLMERRLAEFHAFQPVGEALDVFAQLLERLEQGEEGDMATGLKDLKKALSHPFTGGGLKRPRQFITIVEALMGLGQGQFRTVKALLSELPEDETALYSRLFIEGVLLLKTETPGQLRARWGRLQAWDVKYALTDSLRVSLIGTIPETALVLIGKYLMQAGLFELGQKWLFYLSPANLRVWLSSLEPHSPIALELAEIAFSRYRATGTVAHQLNWLALMIQLESAQGIMDKISERCHTLAQMAGEVGEEEVPRIVCLALILTLESQIIGDLESVRVLHEALVVRCPEKLLPRLELFWLDFLEGKETNPRKDWSLEGLARYERPRVAELFFNLELWDLVIDLFASIEVAGLQDEELEMLVFAYLRRNNPRDDVKALDLSKHFKLQEWAQLVQAEVFQRQGHTQRALYLFKKLTLTPNGCQMAARERLGEIQGLSLEEEKLPEPLPLFERPIRSVSSLEAVVPKRSRYLKLVENVLGPLAGEGSFEHMKIRRKDVVALVRHLGGVTSFGKGSHLRVSLMEQKGFSCILSEPLLPSYQIRQLAVAFVEAGIIPKSVKNKFVLSGGVIMKANDTLSFDDAGALL
jgi:hypothetical protein